MEKSTVLFTFAGDREGANHQIDLTGRKRRLSLAGLDHLQLDAVGVAEDAARDLAGEVDVEAVQLA